MKVKDVLEKMNPNTSVQITFWMGNLIVRSETSKASYLTDSGQDTLLERRVVSMDIDSGTLLIKTE